MTDLVEQGVQFAQDALEAAGIDGNIAKEWTSWGGPQIMGFHWQALGYRSVDHMTETYQDSEAAMIRDFYKFVSDHPELVQALQNGDYATFGGGYNGSRAYGDDLLRNVRAAEESIN